MSELYYSLSTQEYKNQLYLIIDIQIKEKRLLYRDTLQSFGKENDKGALAFLIRQELFFLGISPLSSSASTASFNRVRVNASHSNEAIKLLAGTGRLFWKGKKLMVDPFTPVEFFYEALEKEGGLLEVKGRIRYAGKEEDACNAEMFFPGSPAWFIHNGIWQALSPDIDWKWIQMGYPDLKILGGKKKEQFLDQFEDGGYNRAPRVVWNVRPVCPETRREEPLPFFILSDRSGAFGDLWMDYGPYGKTAFHDLNTPPWRDAQSEKMWEKDLLETDFVKKIVGTSHYYCPLDKVSKSLSFLLEIGWKIFDHQGKKVVRQTTAELQLNADEREIFVRGKVSYASHQVNLSDVLGSFNRRERFVDLGKDAVGLIDHEKVEGDWAELAGYENGGEMIALDKSHFAVLEPFFKDNTVVCDGEASQLSLQGIDKKRELSLPSSEFQGTLHPYQQEGVNWLSFLYKRGFSGLLADEMGLGKTVQLLAFFSTLEKGKSILIVVPTSLLFNWRLEIEKFLLGAQVYVHSGPERCKTEEDLKDKRIILTSYALLRFDALLLQSLDYACIVLDEAQNIKNADTMAASCAFQLKGRMRVAVTGTPIENRWEDLWSLFHFISPGLLGDKQEFNARMLAASMDGRYLARLRKKVSPFILRRSKGEIADQLPPKYEQVIWIEMTEKQRGIYEQWLAGHRSGLLKKVQEDGLSSHRMEILEAILRLRQICCHPHLIDGSYDTSDDEMSAKLERVLSDVHSVLEENHKVIIYSQFTQMLRLLEGHIQSKGWKYSYLDGSTKDREGAVKQFQEDPRTAIFLISLKAGGVGLNLTAADYVFIFDPWWNEAVEKQAIDRAHRFGRKEQVIARRYVTSQCIEEKMMHLKERKSLLASSLLDFDQPSADLTLEDLYQLI